MTTTTKAFNFLDNNRNLVSFILEVFIISIFALFLTLFNAGFDIRKANWTVFAMTDVFNIYTRTVATKYSSAKEKQENVDVNKLSTLIKERKHAIIKLAKQEKIIDALNYYNYQQSFKIYLELLHKKNDKLNPEKKRQKKKRDKLDEEIKHVAYLIDLLKQKKYDAYDEYVVDYHLRSLQLKYSHIKYNDLFVGKSKTDKYGQEKTTFNLFTTSVKRALPSWVALTVISMFWSSLYGQVKTSADLWFMLGSYAFAIIMGMTWGLKNGKQIIAEDLLCVLTTRTDITTILLVDSACKDEIDNEIKMKQDNTTQ